METDEERTPIAKSLKIGMNVNEFLDMYDEITKTTENEENRGIRKRDFLFVNRLKRHPNNRYCKNFTQKIILNV